MKGLNRFWIFFSVFYVLIIGSLPVHAYQVGKQQFSRDFSYRDTQNRLLKGILKLDYEINQISDITDINVYINVVWYDFQGYKIIEDSEKPYLYISIYDLIYEPDNSLNCVSFDDGPNDFHFQNNVSLTYKSMSLIDFEDLNITYDFRYALSILDYDTGKMERIIIPGTTRGISTKLFIPVNKQVIEEDLQDENINEIAEQEEEKPVNIDSINQIDNREEVLKPFRNQLDAFQKRLEALKASKDRLSPARYISSYETNLNNIAENKPKELQGIFDGLTDQGEHVSNMLNGLNRLQLDIDRFTNTLDNRVDPNNILTGIKASRNEIFLEISSLKLEYQTHRDDVDFLLRNSKFDSLHEPENNSNFVFSPDSLVDQFHINNMLLTDFNQEFTNIQREYDSLKLINEVLDPADLSTLRNRHEKNDGIYSDLILYHDSLNNNYLNYDIYNGVAVKLDSLHNQFKIQHSIVEQKRNFLESIFRDSGQGPTALTDSKNVFTWLYILSGIILAAFIYFIIRRVVAGIKGGDKGPEIGFESWAGGYDPFSLSERNSSKGDELKLYYPLTWEELNGGFVRFVFLSQNVINEIYNFSRNSVSRKLVYEVGGYLFGHYERVGPNGIGSYNIFIDQFVPARALESSSHYQMDFSNEAIDELEQAIQNNQNMVSLGWFHTHPGHSPILSENNLENHKKHFSEKWQVSIVVDPSEEGCSSAIYTNSYGGKIVQAGNKTDFFRWKDLVVWSDNPEKSNVSTFIPAIDTNEKSYYTSRLNDKWCDSVVSQVSVEKDCVVAIEKITRKKDFRLKKSKIAGFLYGNVYEKEVDRSGGAKKEYDVVIEELIESGPGNLPSKTSGYNLMGWFGFDDCEIFELIEPALEIQENEFKDKWHLAFLLNRTNNELRIFSRRKSLEMNNNIIETNELSLKEMIDWAKAPERSK